MGYDPRFWSEYQDQRKTRFDTVIDKLVFERYKRPEMTATMSESQFKDVKASLQQVSAKLSKVEDQIGKLY